jgi:hypothetical protein
LAHRRQYAFRRTGRNNEAASLFCFIVRRTVLLACVVLGSLLAAAPAQASRNQELVFDAPRDLMSADTRPGALDELQSLGVRSLRVLMYWKQVAPDASSRTHPSRDLSDPATYDWGQYAPLIEAARERGMSVLLTVTTPGPVWGMRDKRDDKTYPNASDFGRFVEAAGKRFGEQIDVWAVGNEPNHPDFLRPQYRNGEAVAPRLYRALFRSADAALQRTGNGDDTLLIGETLPRGRRGRSVAPLAFLRGMLCLNRAYKETRSCGRLNADGFAHHPYTTKQGPYFASPNPDDVTIGTLSRLTRALDRAARAGALRARMPLWLTEFGIQSTPDRFTGVSLTRQVQWRSLAERIAWNNPRVRAFSQYLLRDDLPVEGVRASQRYSGFESGLRFSTGRPKPSLDGFKLPLAALRDGSRVSLWGLVRPATGVVSADVLIQDAGRKGFRRLRTVRTNARGYFTLRTTYRRGRRYRLSWQGAESAPVTAYTR